MTAPTTAETTGQPGVREYYVTAAMLKDWGTCDERNRALRLFRGQPGVPLTPEGFAIVATIGSDIAYYLGFLAWKKERWERLRARIIAELDLEIARRDGKRGVNHLREARRMVVSTNVSDIWSHLSNCTAYYKHFLAESEGLAQSAARVLAGQWLVGMLLRTLDEEPEGTVLNPYYRQ